MHLLCYINRNFAQKILAWPIPKDVQFQASTELRDNAQVGFFVSKKVNDEARTNFGFGLKKVLNSRNTLKGKIDRNLNATIYFEHKTGGALALQATVEKNLSGNSGLNGYLGSDYAIGLKLKYDN